MSTRRNCFKSLVLILLLAVSSCSGFLDNIHPKTSKTSPDYSKAPLRNEAVVKYVNSVGLKLFQNIDNPPSGISKINVIILETSRIQGASVFTSPRIEMTRGMLNVIRNEAELSALIGHEIGHKVLHGNKRAPTTDNEVTKARWNQQQEKEADEYGALLAGKAGYDPYALVDFFDRLSCFQKRNLFTMMDERSATHKDFVNRSKDLRKVLEKKGIARGGLLKAEEYKLALAPLRSIHTQDIVNEILPGGPSGLLPKLADIKTEIQGYEKSHESMPPARFIEIMDGLSDIVKRSGIDPNELLTRQFSKIIKKQPSFMKEEMSQDSPVWADEEMQKEIESVVQNIGRIGIGFIPAISDAVDMYEFLSGKEFGTGRVLAFSERVLTAGALLIGSGKMWRETAHVMEQTLTDAKYVQKFGRRIAADGGEALANAEKIGESVSRWEYHTPINPGPLDQKIVQTFRSGTYMQETLTEPLVLYRVYSDPGKKFGQYWTRIKPSGPLQMTIDSALDPSFRNQATQLGRYAFLTDKASSKAS